MNLSKTKLISVFLLISILLPLSLSAGSVEESLAPFDEELPQATISRTSITELFRDFIAILWVIVLGLAVIMLLVGSIMWMTSGGNQTRAGNAKRLIIYALIGFAVALVARTSLELVIRLLGAG